MKQDRSIAYQASPYYQEIQEACGKRHESNTSYCGNCKLMVGIVERAVKSALEEQVPTLPLKATIELVDEATKVVRQEARAWAEGSPGPVIHMVTRLADHVAKELTKLKYPPSETRHLHIELEKAQDPAQHTDPYRYAEDPSKPIRTVMGDPGTREIASDS